ncbi:MAG: 23S rRNA (pseudouridine(1915)-N(3))-methyltransferase RlmH [Verrucomicrobia bacterium]|nr:23S rRNA (pseudouridine(1915)-N(3))-methyltransferase RlmH [Verrucomicrobiota bacterium]
MRLRVVVAGKPSLAYAKAGAEEYQRRLAASGRFDILHVKAGTPSETSARLLAQSTGCLRVALDERGESWSTRGLADWLGSLESSGTVKCVAFLIGAADGHDDALRRSCDRVLALSSFTLQHELALVVLLEQLYRVASLRAGSPYHRD